MNARDRFVRPKEASRLTGLSRTTIWRLTQRKEFPKCHRISAGACAYKMSELMQWIEDRSTANAA